VTPQSVEGPDPANRSSGHPCTGEPYRPYPLAMRVGVLGPVEAETGGAPVELGPRKQRALLALLALAGGRAVSVDAIADALWPEGAPASLSSTLQAYVARLRRSLEPERVARARPTVVVTVEPGYALRLPPGALDADVFESSVADVHRLLVPTDPDAVSPGEGMDAARLTSAVDRLDAALAAWRGTPYAELGDHPGATAERVRLEELRLLAREDRAAACLGLGRHAEVASDLEALVAEHPLRERAWGAWALALFRSGRQADALDALRRVRRLLGDELGIEPSPAIRRLQDLVLRQDPALDWRPPPVGRSLGDLADAPDPAPAARGANPVVAVSATPPWPLVGREADLAALVEALDRADEGTPALAALVGDPGIGKTRLAGELAARARERGAVVLVGRCSQDDGAPPLRPWRQALGGLGLPLPTPAGEDEGGAFQVWEALVQAVLDAAAERLVVLVLDDLHWADEPTLRALRLLGEVAERGRLLVLATWRDHPEPEGALLDAAETFARRHAVRRDLRGLDADAAARLVGEVTEHLPTRAEAATLNRRTDGNPFFLVEYARLARERRDLAAVLADPDPPAAVHDVLARRVARLPEETRLTLRWAAVIGREFDLDVLAEVADVDEETALDRLDPAVVAGLVREQGVDGFAFAHALVRDAVRGTLPASRRARAHHRVAEALARRPGTETAVARHLLDAGPAHASRAWPAAVRAAGIAAGLHAHTERADLLRAALDAMAEDPGATPRDRCDLLLDLADAQRWAGDWAGLVATTEQAIAAAEAIGDVALLARAAMGTAVGAIWQSGGHGTVHEGVVAGLRRALAELPPEDGSDRCRVMLALAVELYYGSSPAERAALVEEGLAMARRLRDDHLLLDVLQLAQGALWSPGTAEQRREWVVEAVDLADRLRRGQAAMVASTMHAVIAAELGRIDEHRRAAEDARARCERLRSPYGLIVLDGLQLPWEAMAGRFEEAERLLGEIVARSQRMSLPQGQDAVAGALVALRLWQGRAEEVIDVFLAYAESSPMPLSSAVAVLMLRAGHREDAVAYLAEHPVDLSGDDWQSMLTWAYAAEAALGVGDPALGAAAYARLAPYEGRSASAGSGNATGPVDAFLACAAAAVGDLRLAAHHADRAEELALAWDVPLVARWLRDQRDAVGF
jgi:DNA-binding SARP family transcriptional activator